MRDRSKYHLQQAENSGKNKKITITAKRSAIRDSAQ